MHAYMNYTFSYACSQTYMRQHVYVCMYECRYVCIYPCTCTSMCIKSTAMSMYTFLMSLNRYDCHTEKYDPQSHYATWANRPNTFWVCM